MSSSSGAPLLIQHGQPQQSRRIRLRSLLVTAVLALLVGLSAGPTVIYAEAPTPPGVQPSAATNQPQLVFTMGTVASVTRDAVTLRFEDGQTETYTVGSATTLQNQDGNTAKLSDLDVGDMAMIIVPEGSTTAAVIVDGGDVGFDAGGPFDIGESEGT